MFVMPENERPDITHYIAAFVSLAAMFAIALSPLEGLFWDGVVLALLAFSLIALGQALYRNLIALSLIVAAGIVLLPLLFF